LGGKKKGGERRRKSLNFRKKEKEGGLALKVEGRKRSADHISREKKKKRGGKPDLLINMEGRKEAKGNDKKEKGWD